MILRIKKFLITLIGVLYGICLGGLKRNSPQEVFLVVHPTGNIGDVVCDTPLIHAIKKHHPESKVIVLCSKIASDILEYHPDVDECININQSAWNIIQLLRNRKVDFGLMVNPDAFLISLLALGGVPAVSTFTFDAKYKNVTGRPYKLISPLCYQTEYVPGKYVPFQLLQLLLCIGIEETDVKKKLYIDGKSKNKAESLLASLGVQSEEKVIVIAPGAGADYKRWPANRFAQVSHYAFKNHSVATVLIGGPNDAKAVEAFLSHVDSLVPVYNPGPLSMELLKATLSRSVLLVGNDSGPVHVAQAMDIPTIAVVGTTDYNEHLRTSQTDMVIASTNEAKNPYQSYVDDEDKIDSIYAKSQMDSIELEDVLTALDTVMSKHTI